MVEQSRPLILVETFPPQDIPERCFVYDLIDTVKALVAAFGDVRASIAGMPWQLRNGRTGRVET